MLLVTPSFFGSRGAMVSTTLPVVRLLATSIRLRISEWTGQGGTPVACEAALVNAAQLCLPRRRLRLGGRGRLTRLGDGYPVWRNLVVLVGDLIAEGVCIERNFASGGCIGQISLLIRGQNRCPKMLRSDPGLEIRTIAEHRKFASRPLQHDLVRLRSTHPCGYLRRRAGANLHSLLPEIFLTAVFRGGTESLRQN